MKKREIKSKIKKLFESELADMEKKEEEEGVISLTDKPFAIDDALIEKIGKEIDITKYDVEQLKMGIEVEKEHGSQRGEDVNVTKDDPITTARIAIAHLKEISDYYTRLATMEAEAKEKEAPAQEEPKEEEPEKEKEEPEKEEEPKEEPVKELDEKSKSKWLPRDEYLKSKGKVKEEKK